MAFKPDKSSRILFALVAKSTSILASHCGVVGNFNDVARDLLLKLDQQAKFSSSPTMPTRMTYKDGNYLYHYFVEHGQGVIFLCITEDAFPRKIAFDLMDTLAGKLIQQFPYQLQSKVQMSPFSLNGEFEPIIRAEMEEANTNAINYKESKEESFSEKEYSGNEEYPSTSKPTLTSEKLRDPTQRAKGSAPGDPDKVERVRDEVARVKDIMVTNIEALLDRGERLDLLVDKTDQLSSSAVTFKQSSRTLARRMWWQNIKMWVWIGIVVLVVLYIIVSASCGGPTWPKCVGGNGNGTKHY